MFVAHPRPGPRPCPSPRSGPNRIRSLLFEFGTFQIESAACFLNLEPSKPNPQPAFLIWNLPNRIRSLLFEFGTFQTGSAACFLGLGAQGHVAQGSPQFPLRFEAFGIVSAELVFVSFWCQTRTVAIYNNQMLSDFYEMGEEMQNLGGGVGIICAEGQPILKGYGLAPRTVQDYFRGVMVKGSLLAYPGMQQATLVSGLGSELAVWMVGTGFAIGAYDVLTAWHVVQDVLGEVDSDDPKKLRFVRGYLRKSSGASAPQYTVHEVVKATRLGTDVGRLELKTAVPRENVLPVLTHVNYPRDDHAISIIGHPLGQPLKFADGKIEDADPNNDRSQAHVRISASSGNSGSPVIWRGEVLGVFCNGNWPSEFAPTKNTDWSHLYWDDDSNNGASYHGGVEYIGDLV